MGAIREQVPAAAPASAEIRRGLWPVDWLMLSYLLGIGLLIACHSRQIEHLGWLLLVHASACLPIIAYAYLPQFPGAYLFRRLYPIFYVFACYRVMSVLIRSIREARFDELLAACDRALWHANPTVWLERLQTPALTELLQIIYTLFVPVVLAVAAIVWVRRREEFRSYALLVTLGFLSSYLLYFVVPARGPRYLLDGLQTRPLSGLWLYGPLRHLLDVLESSHYDCFPSGHTEMTLLAWWTTCRISKPLSAFYMVYTALILVATVYLRYHYTVDLVAGAALAALVWWTAPLFERAPVRQEKH